ncbi:MAG TPA: gamma-glutamyl-gamma-aminobutyrate hydrolase family protein [Trebonia sp.]|jgi:putative glutamine amidotransferase
MATPLRLACIDSAAAPLFDLAGADGSRRGYEPAVGALLAETLGRELEWVYLPWAKMLPSLDDGRADAVLCGQSIIAARQAVADFTAPYAVFHESVLVRAGDPVASPADLRGRRVAAIAGSTNMALAETFDEAVPVPFGGESDDVFGDMLAALRDGAVDAVVDDDAVLRAGGEPVVVHGGDRAAVAEVPARLARFDGVCLPGGGDVSPARYGQAADPRSEPPDDLQDEFDLAVIRTVLGITGPARALPALAICRGLQVLNVACGGTLRQHVGGGPVEHLNALHEVTIARGSRLRRLVGADTITVSSYHHQAVGRLGTGLRAVACAPDGCVEAVEHHQADVLAVQWHPEDQAATRAYDQALFDDLVARARASAAVTAGLSVRGHCSDPGVGAGGSRWAPLAWGLPG